MLWEAISEIPCYNNQSMIVQYPGISKEIGTGILADFALLFLYDILNPLSQYKSFCF